MKYTAYFTYIAECGDGTYYVGQTNNLLQRFKQHNGLLLGGAKYTRGRGPVICRYYEKWTTRSMAMHREYILKKLSHRQKEALCSLTDIFRSFK